MATQSYQIRFESSGWGQLRRQMQALTTDTKATEQSLEGLGRETDNFQLRAARNFRLWNKSVNNSYQVAMRRLRSNLRRNEPPPPPRAEATATASSNSSAAVSNQPDHTFWSGLLRQNKAQQQRETAAQARQRTALQPIETKPFEVQSIRLDGDSFISEWQTVNRELIEEFSEALRDELREVNGNPFQSILMAPLSLAGSALENSLGATFVGAFAGIGESLTIDLGQGIAKSIQGSMGLPFEEVGNDIGDMIGSFMLFVTTRTATAIRDTSLSGNVLLHTETALLDVFSELFRQIGIKMPLVLARAYRRVQINKNALDSTQLRAGIEQVESRTPQHLQKKINESKSISLVAGGYNQDVDDFGKNYTAAVLQPLLAGSAVIPIKRQSLNDVSAYTSRIVENLLSRALEVPGVKKQVAETIKKNLQQLPQNELEKIFGRDIKIDFESVDDLVKVARMMAESQDFSILKNIDTMLQGFSADDILLAAEAIKYINENPGKPLQLVGFSQGGNEVAGALEILQRMGFDEVKGVTLGTPITPLSYSGDPSKLLSIMGSQDYYYAALRELLKVTNSPVRVLEGEGVNHALPSYATGTQTKGLIKNFLGDRIDMPSSEEYGVRDAMAMYYMNQDGMSASIERAILNMLGVGSTKSVSKGRYGFNSKDLGSTHPKAALRTLKAAYKKATNEDVKAVIQNYIELIEQTITELERFELAQVSGIDYRPTNLLDKALPFFPQLAELKNIAPVDTEARAQLDAMREANPKLQQFATEVMSQAPNIQNTFAAMGGQKLGALQYSFFDPQEFKDRAENGLGGLIDWLKNEFQAGASAEDQELMQPFIEFFERFQKAVIDAGEKGEIDSSVVREADKLFGGVLPNDLLDKLGKKTTSLADLQPKDQPLLEVYPELKDFIRLVNESLKKQGQEPLSTEELSLIGKTINDYSLLSKDQIIDISNDASRLKEFLDRLFGNESPLFRFREAENFDLPIIGGGDEGGGAEPAVTPTPRPPAPPADEPPAAAEPQPKTPPPAPPAPEAVKPRVPTQTIDAVPASRSPEAVIAEAWGTKQSSMLDKVIDGLTQAGKEAVKTAKPLAEQAAEKLNELGEAAGLKAQEVVESTIEAVKQRVQEEAQPERVQQRREQVRQGLEAAKGTAQQVGQGLAGEAGELRDAAVEGVRGLRGGAEAGLNALQRQRDLNRLRTALKRQGVPQALREFRESVDADGENFDIEAVKARAQRLVDGIAQAEREANEIVESYASDDAFQDARFNLLLETGKLKTEVFDGGDSRPGLNQLNEAIQERAFQDANAKAFARTAKGATGNLQGIVERAEASQASDDDLAYVRELERELEAFYTAADAAKKTTMRRFVRFIRNLRQVLQGVVSEPIDADFTQIIDDASRQIDAAAATKGNPIAVQAGAQERQQLPPETEQVFGDDARFVEALKQAAEGGATLAQISEALRITVEELVTVIGLLRSRGFDVPDIVANRLRLAEGQRGLPSTGTRPAGGLPGPDLQALAGGRPPALPAGDQLPPWLRWLRPNRQQAKQPEAGQKPKTVLDSMASAIKMQYRQIVTPERLESVRAKALDVGLSSVTAGVNALKNTLDLIVASSNTSDTNRVKEIVAGIQSDSGFADKLAAYRETVNAENINLIEARQEALELLQMIAEIEGALDRLAANDKYRDNADIKKSISNQRKSLGGFREEVLGGNAAPGRAKVGIEELNRLYAQAVTETPLVQQFGDRVQNSAEIRQVFNKTLDTEIADPRLLDNLLNELYQLYGAADEFQREAMQSVFLLLAQMRGVLERGQRTGLLDTESMAIIAEDLKIPGFNAANLDKGDLEVDADAPLKQVLQAYNQKLEAVVRFASEGAARQIQGINPDNLLSPEALSKQFLYNDKSERPIQQKMQRYREQARQARDQVSRAALEALAKEILADIQNAKRAYEAGIRQQLQQRNPVSGTRLGAAELGNLTKMQGEIISGNSQVTGWDSVGMVRRLAKADTAAIEQVRQSGANIVQAIVGEVQSRLAELDATGQAMGEAVVEGTERAFEIQSPSRVFEGIAAQLFRGFRDGIELEDYEATGEEIAEAVNRGVEEGKNPLDALDQFLQPNSFDGLFGEGAGQGVDQFGGGVIDAISETFSSLMEQFPIIGKIQEAFGELFSSIAGALGLYQVGDFFVQFASEALAAALQVEKLSQVIRNVSRDGASAAKSLAFVRGEARRLNIDLVSALQAYSSFMGSSQNTPLEGAATDRIFSAFAESALVYGLNADETTRMFTAVQQMMSKGKIQAEELRGQLGEVLPGIQNTLAMSLGVTPQELDAMLQRGELLSTDVLPRLAAQLSAQNASSVAGAAQTTQAAINNFNNALTEFRVEAGGGWLQSLQKALANIGAAFLRIQDGGLAINVTILALLTGLATLAKMIATSATLSKLWLTLTTAVGFAMKAMLATVAALALKMALVGAAIATVSTVIGLIQNPFPEIEQSMRGAERRAAALRRELESVNAVSEAQSAPESVAELRPTGPIDRFVRQPLANFNEQLDGLLGSNGRRGLGLGLGVLGIPLLLDTTNAEREMNSFVEQVNRLTAQNFDNLSAPYTEEVTQAVEELKALESQLVRLESQRLDIMPNDRVALEANTEQIQTLRNRADELRGMIGTVQEGIQGAIDDAEARIIELDQMLGDRRITQSVYDSSMAGLESQLSAAQQALDFFNAAVGEVPQAMAILERAMRGVTEELAGLRQNIQRGFGQNRAAVFREAMRLGLGAEATQRQIRQLALGESSQLAGAITDNLAQLNRLLGDPTLQQRLATLRKRAEAEGSNLENLATLNRLLEQSQNGEEQRALRLLIQQQELQGELIQVDEQIAQQTQDLSEEARQAGIQVRDFVASLVQRLRESALEVLRQANTLRQQAMRTDLQRVFSAGYDTLAESFAQSITGLIDQAFQIQERVLGVQGQQVAIEQEERTLNQELDDFARNLGSATEALQGFINGLSGRAAAPSSSQTGDYQAGSTMFDALRRAIIGQESGGQFNAVNPHSGALGYGQVMPQNLDGTWGDWAMDALGRSLSASEFLADPAAQIAIINHRLGSYLERELAASGGDIQMAVRRAAASWYSGQAGLFDDARPQTYGAGSYPSIRDYTLSIWNKFQAEGGLQAPIATPAIQAPTEVYDPAQVEVASDLAALGSEILDNRRRVIELSERQIELDVEALRLAAEQFNETGAEQARRGLLESEGNILNLRNKLEDMRFGAFGVQLPELEFEKQMRDLGNQFRETDLGIDDAIRQATDELGTAEQLIERLQALVENLRSSGSESDALLAGTFEQTIGLMQANVPLLQSNLEQLQQIQNEAEAAQQTAQRLVELQAEAAVANRDFGRASELGNLDVQRLDAEAQLLRSNRFEFEAVALQRQAAIMREQFSLRQQTLEIEQQMALLREQMSTTSDPDLLAAMQGELDFLGQKLLLAQQISQVNLQNINEQFRGIGQVIRDDVASNLETFFTDLATGTKSFQDALEGFLRSILATIARIAAQRLVAGLFGGMFAGGGTVGGKVKGFADGGTVPGLINSIGAALKAEGPRGVLAVFTPGEEILSLKTGEAQRYQSLKARLGKNPLQKLAVENFAKGGTVRANLLANLPRTQPRLALAELSHHSTSVSRPVSVTMTVVTPDANSFRSSRGQIERDLGVTTRRALNRND
ncbi:MAG: hypothetical protein DDT26_00107 [Dehalococcoidia bacterium]|nr:hypothetical protein [Chloroflexota bacterium]